MSCPSGCSGNGRCLPMSMLNSTNTYSSAWDAEKAHACVCDRGYGGVDCSLRLCPKGDDPLTTSQNDRVYSVSLYGTTLGEFVFKFTDNFGTTWTTRPLAIGRYVESLELGNVTAAVTGSTYDTSTDASLSTSVAASGVREGDYITIGSTYHRITAISGDTLTLTPNVSTTVDEKITLVSNGATPSQVEAAFEDLPNRVADVSVAWNSTYSGSLDDRDTVSHGAGQNYVITFHHPSNLLKVDPLVVDWSACTDAGCQPHRIGRGTPSTSNTFSYVTAGSGITVTVDATVGYAFDSATDSANSNDVGIIEFELTDTTPNAKWREGTTGAWNSAIDFSGGQTLSLTNGDVSVTLAGGASGDRVFVELDWGVEVYDITPISCSGDFREADECSGRGLCDYETGICQCFTGYSDHDCSVQTTLV